MARRSGAWQHSGRRLRYHDGMPPIVALLATRWVRRAWMPILSVLAIAACSSDVTAPTDSVPQLEVTLVTDGLQSPVWVGSPARDPRLFVAERGGRIRVVRDGRLLDRAFLDLSAEVSTAGSERGLLGVAFHPRFATNRQVFVTFVQSDGSIKLARFTASGADPDVVDPGSRVNIRRIPHPGFVHYGGMIQFLPDGTLLWSVGDAGSGNDGGGDSQLPTTLRGKLVRITVDDPPSGRNFGVPTDNPFLADAGFRPEIFALGLRNPWRFWVDGPSGQLFVSDVGEGSYEELNVLPLASAAGSNFGWSLWEGPLCLPTSRDCDVERLVTPDVAYPHGPGCNAITGGVVYRGSAHPEHAGRYFYADFCQGWVRSLRAALGEVSEELEWALSRPMNNVTSFGVDGAGEVLAVTFGGELLRLGRGSR
jgi:glucose/arabinose dehydrogenase